MSIQDYSPDTSGEYRLLECLDRIARALESLVDLAESAAQTPDNDEEG